jgi:hypothetical protein
VRAKNLSIKHLGRWRPTSHFEQQAFYANKNAYKVFMLGVYTVSFVECLYF